MKYMPILTEARIWFMERNPGASEEQFYTEVGQWIVKSSRETEDLIHAYYNGIKG